MLQGFHKEGEKKTPSNIISWDFFLFWSYKQSSMEGLSYGQVKKNTHLIIFHNSDSSKAFPLLSGKIRYQLVLVRYFLMTYNTIFPVQTNITVSWFVEFFVNI